MWSHPDINLPDLLVLVRAFVDLIILASGYTSRGNVAYWATEDMKRALSWASLLEQIIGKLPLSQEGKDSRQVLDASLIDLMADSSFPKGIPRLSSEALGEARKFLVKVFIQAPGIDNRQIDSLIAATYESSSATLFKEQKGQVHAWYKGQATMLQNDEKRLEASKNSLWAFAAEQFLDRFSAVSSVNSLSNALLMATQASTIQREVSTEDNRIWTDDLDSANLESVDDDAQHDCCLQWRQKSLLYMLNPKTLYKISGAAMVFKTSETQWRQVLSALEENSNGDDQFKAVEIVELCCLMLASPRLSNLARTLLKPCCHLCSKRSLTNQVAWMDHHIKLKVNQKPNLEIHGVEMYLQKLLIEKANLWWSLPPIILASALTKGSPLFDCYIGELFKYQSRGWTSSRCYCNSCEVCLQRRYSDEVPERIWCLQIQDLIELQ